MVEGVRSYGTGDLCYEPKDLHGAYITNNPLYGTSIGLTKWETFQMIKCILGQL